VRVPLGSEIRTHGLTPIYETSAFRALAAPAHEEGEPCVVVEALGKGDAAEAALDALFAAHSDPPHPLIARAVERVRGEHGSFVVFDIPATTDLETVIRYATAANMRANHHEADGFIVSLREALLISARTPGRDERHRFLGTLAMSNVLFAPDGRFWLLGFGHNVAAYDEAGRLVARAPVFRPQEIVSGEKPTAQSDFVALLLLVRGIIDLVDVNDTIARTLRTNSLLEDLEIVKHILFIESHVVHAHPRDRAPIDQAVEVSHRIRALTGVRPDPAAFIARVGELLESRLESTETRRRNLLRVCPAGTWFDRGRGPRVDLSRFTGLGRLLVLLVTERIVRPGEAIAATTLARASTHGERIFADASLEQVHATMVSLMRLGLATDVERVGDGYRIATHVECLLVSG
jgi:hypothetical protein